MFLNFDWVHYATIGRKTIPTNQMSMDLGMALAVLVAITSLIFFYFFPLWHLLRFLRGDNATTLLFIQGKQKDIFEFWSLLLYFFTIFWFFVFFRMTYVKFWIDFKSTCLVTNILNRAWQKIDKKQFCSCINK